MIRWHVPYWSHLHLGGQVGGIPPSIQLVLPLLASVLANLISPLFDRLDLFCKTLGILFQILYFLSMTKANTAISHQSPFLFYSIILVIWVLTSIINLKLFICTTLHPSHPFTSNPVFISTIYTTWQMSRACAKPIHNWVYNISAHVSLYHKHIS